MRILARRKVEISFKEVSAIYSYIFHKNKTDNKKILKFEEQFSRYIGVKYAITVPSGRIGLSILLENFGFKYGDEVIISSYNYPVIPALIKTKGLKPIFLDVDPQTYNINTSLIKESITSKTRCIIATHLFGRTCDIEEIMNICKEYNLILIEDVAHACGAEYKNIKLGNFGDASYFSFGTGKALVAFGGGMLVTNNNLIFEKIRTNLNSSTFLYNKYFFRGFMKAFFEVVCTNRIIFSLFVYPVIFFATLIGSSFLDKLTDDRDILEEVTLNKETSPFNGIQAAVGIIQLDRLDEMNDRRIYYARMLSRLLGDIDEIRAIPTGTDRTNIALYYCIFSKQAKELRKFLALRGVDTKKGSMKACSSLGYFDNRNKCPIAEEISENIIELPCYPSLTPEEIYYQANLIREFYGDNKC